MSKEYQQEVLLAYRKKAKEKVLSDNLINPTRAKLKEECLRAYRAGSLTTNDRKILKEFLGIFREIEDYDQSIIDHDDGKFRPLDNFLKKEKYNPHIRIVDLLAWLIDFPVRPFSIWKDRNPVNPPSSNLFKFLKNQFEKLRSDQKTQVAFVFLVVVTFLGGLIFIYPINFGNQCMYWTGDHYEAIACDGKAGDASIIALDKQKIDHLKRITTPDTITQKNLGNVWYIKIKKDSLEYYTDSGAYPLNDNKRLLPLTDYMFNKYILKKDSL